MSNLKTNNTFLTAKVDLRVNHLPEKNDIVVLDAYCGKGTIWGKVKAESEKNIKVLGIDKAKHKNVDIICDNLKVLASIDLSRFDVIDLDAYGVPFAQMQVLLNRGFMGRVFVTFIQSFKGAMPTGILRQAGFSREMIRKSSTLFTKDPLFVLEQFLTSNKITTYTKKSLDRKHYLFYDAPMNKNKGESEK